MVKNIRNTLQKILRLFTNYHCLFKNETKSQCSLSMSKTAAHILSSILIIFIIISCLSHWISYSLPKGQWDAAWWPLNTAASIGTVFTWLPIIIWIAINTSFNGGNISGGFWLISLFLVEFTLFYLFAYNLLQLLAGSIVGIIKGDY